MRKIPENLNFLRNFLNQSALDDMGNRIDDLEKNIADLMTQAGVEEGRPWELCEWPRGQFITQRYHLKYSIKCTHISITNSDFWLTWTI